LLAAMEDLTYCARELPQEQLEQVFTQGNLEPFIKAVLRSRSRRSDDWDEERRIYDIAVMLADLSLSKCANYLQDADVDYLQLAARDLSQARLWMKVAGIPNLEKKRRT